MAVNISEEQSVEILTKILTDAGIDFRKKEPNEEGGFFYKENGVSKKFNGNIFVKRLLKYDANLSATIVQINDLCSTGENEEPEVDISSECELTVSKANPQKQIAIYKDTAVQSKLLIPLDKSLDAFDCTMPTDLDAA